MRRPCPEWRLTGHGPIDREPAVLSSRQQGTEEFLGGGNAGDEPSAIPQRMPSSERLTPTAATTRAASRDVWRDARPLGRRRAAREAGVSIKLGTFHGLK